MSQRTYERIKNYGTDVPVERTVAEIEISKDLKLPAEDMLESAIGIIGKRGRGKSGAVKVLMEELVKVNLPFVAFDPVGVMWGIRSSLDGTGPGLRVLVVGGSHGDLKLDRRAGAEIAKAIVQANISCIIDFSEEPKAAYRQFVTDFAHTLFSINDTPRMVIIEEAPELVPQRMRPDLAETFEAVERLVSRGRNKGIGVTLVSQRSATINKDVLTQVDALFVFGVTSPQDRKALREWVEAKGEPDKLAQFEEGIAGLQKQEAWFWSPEAFGGQFRKVKVRNFETFHPDKTHLRRMGLLEKKPMTVEIQPIIQKLGAQLDRLSKEKTDIAQMPRLQSKIQQLEKELEKAKAQTTETSPVDMRKAISEATKPLHDEISQLKGELRASQSLVSRFKRAANTIADVMADASVDSRPVTRLVEVSHPRPPVIRPVVEIRRPKPISVDSEANDSMRSGERRVLEVIASRFPLTLTRAQLGTLSGFTPSGGTYNTYFGDLKRRGLVSEDHQGNVQATQEGMVFLGEIAPAPTTHDEILAMWKRNLRAGEGRMLQEIVAVYPDPISKEELAEKTDYTFTGGTFNTYLGILRRNGLVRIDGNEITATEVLFP